MNMVRNIIIKMKHSKRVILFIAFFFAIFFSFVVFMNNIFVSDYFPGYIERNIPPKIDMVSIISGGRFCNLAICLVYKVLLKFGVSHFRNQFVLQILGIIFYSFSATRIYLMIENKVSLLVKRNQILLFISVLIAFVNPFMIETYMYGSFDFALGIYLGIIGANFWVDKRYCLAALFAFLATTTYQTNIIILLIVIWTVVCCEEIALTKSFVNLVKQITIPGVFCGLMAGICFAFQKIGWKIVGLIGLRKADETMIKDLALGESFSQRARECIKAYLGVIWQSYGMLPKGLIVAILAFSIIAICCVCVRKKTYANMIVLILIVAISVFATFSVGLVLGVYYPQRMMLDLFFVVSMAMCLIVISVEKYLTKDRGLICLAGFIIFGLVYAYTQVCITDAYSAQALDKYEAKRIQKVIDIYEMTTGYEVKEIVYPGAEVSCKYMNYDELLLSYCWWSPYRRIVTDFWGRENYVNLFNNNNYAMREMTEEEVEAYSKGLTGLDMVWPDQFHFEGQTLYWTPF